MNHVIDYRRVNQNFAHVLHNRNLCSGGKCFLSYIFCYSIRICYLANNYSIISAGDMKFHISSPCDKTFRQYQQYQHFDPLSLTVEFGLLFENLSLRSCHYLSKRLGAVATWIQTPNLQHTQLYPGHQNNSVGQKRRRLK